MSTSYSKVLPASRQAPHCDRAHARVRSRSSVSCFFFSSSRRSLLSSASYCRWASRCFLAARSSASSSDRCASLSLARRRSNSSACWAAFCASWALRASYAESKAARCCPPAGASKRASMRACWVESTLTSRKPLSGNPSAICPPSPPGSSFSGRPRLGGGERRSPNSSSSRPTKGTMKRTKLDWPEAEAEAPAEASPAEASKPRSIASWRSRSVMPTPIAATSTSPASGLQSPGVPVTALATRVTVGRKLELRKST
mmetsp:Transcript_13739/g.32543  ORF Transcript_13739/g.32543 Transcript_13739/m.32543 type:complete len:257 (+) Transcript_13739:1404-2174(+)